MAIKMRGVLAVPGEYERDDKKYIKTAEELKRSAERFPIVPLTFGHTQNSEPPTEAQQIGTVSQKWNEQEQRVNAEFWFHEEKIPEKLRLQIQDGHKIPISAWYLADSIDEDGTLHGMSYSHVAVLEGEDPVCPIDQCGAFVVSESRGRHIFVEHTTDLESAPKPAEKETEATPEPTPDEVEVKEQTPKPDAPVEQKPKEPDEEPVAKEEEVRLEPETIIPTELPTVKREFEVIDGKYVWVPPIFRQQEKKE